MNWVLVGGVFLLFCGATTPLTLLGESESLRKEDALAVIKELSPTQWRKEIEAIDQAVGVLTDLRNKELARAARSQDQGDRLQFQFPNLIDARRAWAEADKSRAVAARYQEEINKLAVRKQEILRQRGQKVSQPQKD